MYAVKIFEAFQNEPEKAKILFEFAEKIEKNLDFSGNIATKLDLELSKKELEHQIKQLESKTTIQLKEIEGKIETTKKELEGKIETTKKELEGKIEITKKELEGKIETTKKELEGKIEITKKELEIKIEKSRSSILKWSFLFWITQMASLFGLFYTIVKILQK